MILAVTTPEARVLLLMIVYTGKLVDLMWINSMALSQPSVVIVMDPFPKHTRLLESPLQ